MISANYSISASFFIYLYFIFVVVTGGIIGLSLVNSIFVDSMISDNNDEIDKKIDNLDHKLNDIIKKLEDYETGTNFRKS
jgi:voltage-gated sodium channel